MAAPFPERYQKNVLRSLLPLRGNFLTEGDVRRILFGSWKSWGGLYREVVAIQVDDVLTQRLKMVFFSARCRLDGAFPV